MQPTILTHVARKTQPSADEFFGPVAMFFRVKDEDAAIALANDSDFGLGGSVFTKDIARGKRVASRVETGMMFINNISWSDAELPFGGIKDSGYGRELGDMGIQAIRQQKSWSAPWWLEGAGLIKRPAPSQSKSLALFFFRGPPGTQPHVCECRRAPRRPPAGMSGGWLWSPGQLCRSRRSWGPGSICSRGRETPAGLTDCGLLRMFTFTDRPQSAPGRWR